jgi:hypothetical protein
MVRLLSLYWLLLHINLELTDNEECQSIQTYRSPLEPSTKVRVSVSRILPAAPSSLN